MGFDRGAAAAAAAPLLGLEGGAMVFLESADDMQWLADVHLPEARGYRFAMLHGNEDSPERIELLKRNHVDARRVAFVLAEGSYRRVVPFSALKLGTVFEFDRTESERHSLASGPWVKVGKRSYSNCSDRLRDRAAPVHRVGTVRVGTYMVPLSSVAGVTAEQLALYPREFR